MTRRDESGFTLLETLVALLLTSLVVLGAAPMFARAAHATDAGADIGVVGTLAVDRLEQLRELSWGKLTPGGSLLTDVVGYSDASSEEYIVRWTITNNASPSQTRTIEVLAAARNNPAGIRRQVTVTTSRGR